MREAQGIDPTRVSPEEFAALVTQADDEQIAEVIHGVGTEQVLDRIFQGMKERFRPESAQGVDATIQFVVTDNGAEHAYSVVIANGSCDVRSERAESPRVTLTTDLVSFAKLIAGKEDGMRLFMAGKLKVSGDLMFSTRIMSFFDRPTPAT